MNEIMQQLWTFWKPEEQAKALIAADNSLEGSSFAKMPIELIKVILQFLPRGAWYSTMLACKKFTEIGSQLFDPSIDNNRAIRQASAVGNLLSVKKLLNDPRVDPSIQDNEALRLACAAGYLEVVKRLLKDGRVNLAAKDYEAFVKAAEAGHIDIVRLLRQNSLCQVPSLIEEQALAKAQENKQLNVVEELMGVTVASALFVVFYMNQH